MDVIKKLLDDRIIVDPEMLDNTTKSGIILSTELNAEKQGFGKIMIVADKVKTVKVGQRIIYGRMSGFEMEYQGEMVKVIRETDISAILEEDKK